jgi:type IV secretion system protein VirD4
MSSPYGNAKTNTEEQLVARLGRPERGSIYLGRFYDEKADQSPVEIPYKGDRHLVIFGPTGSGKGSRFLLPNLLGGLEEQSVIIIDPKGEAAAVSAAARARMGHDVIILNPFNVLGLGSAGFNPLAILDPASDTFYDDAAAIGEALIKIEGNEPHWSESAHGLIVALTMWEATQAQREGRAPLLENVRRMLTESDVTELDADGKRQLVGGFRITATRMATEGDEEIASLIGRFTRSNDEIASILSTADTQTRWMLSKPMRRDLAKDGIDFATLKKRPVTVYVILPAQRLRTHSVWLRLVIVSALRSLYTSGGRRTLMLIDEMAALGHLGPLEDAFGLVRGYNIQIAAMLQDLGQLKALYKERWETFMANAGVVYGFAPNDLTTAEWMSKRSGQTTVVAKAFSENSGESVSQQVTTSAGQSLGDQQFGRPLFLPHELFGFEEGMGLLWLAGLDDSTRFFAPDYQMITKCEAAASPNPYRLQR